MTTNHLNNLIAAIEWIALAVAIMAAIVLILALANKILEVQIRRSRRQAAPGPHRDKPVRVRPPDEPRKPERHDG